MSTINPFEIALMWHNVILSSSGPEDVGRYSRLLHRSGAEIRIITLVKQNPDIMIKEILEQLNVPKSTLTSILDRLEKQGILCRVISNRDRRSYGLKLTEEGTGIFDEFMEYQTGIGIRILQSLNEKEQRLLNELLIKVSRNLVTR